MPSNIRTVIEITETHIKLIQAKRSGGRTLVLDQDACSIEGKLDEDIQLLLLQMIRPRSVDPDNFIMVLPRRLSSIRRLRIPSSDDKEIRKMLPIQISHMLPHLLEDLVYDYEILERENGGYAKLIIYIVHKDVGDRYARLLERSKVLPSKYVLSSQGVVEWSRLKKDRVGDAPILFLNLDLAHAEACFIQDGRLLFSRVINGGVSVLHHDGLSSFVDQVEQSVRLYRKERFGEDVAGIFVISAMEISELTAVLGERFHLPVESFHHQDDINISSNKIKSGMPDCPGVSFAVCLGLASAESKNLMNLIAKHVRNVKDADAKRKYILRFIIAAFSFWFVFLCWIGADYFYNSHALQQVKEQVFRFDTDAMQARDKVGLVVSIDQYLSKRFSFSSFIIKLYQIMPPDVSLRSLSIDRGGAMVIGGYAQSGSSVNLFQSRLVSSPEFSDVTLQFTAKRKLYNKDLVEFKIQFKLKKPQ